MFTKRLVRKQLKNCNYAMVVDLIKDPFAGAVIKEDLSNKFDKFNSNPCFDTAFELIKYDPKFLYYFELARDSVLTETLYKQVNQK